MSAKQPGLGLSLAALSCGMGLLGLAACGSTALPAGLPATGSLGQTSDAGVMKGSMAGEPAFVTPPTTAPTRPPTTTPTTPVAGTGGTRMPPMSRDAGAMVDSGLVADGGMPVWPDGGVVGIDAGFSCSSDGVYPTDVNAYDQRGLSVLRGCKRVRGSVFIGSNSIEDLSDLSDLTMVDGRFQISSALWNDSSTSELSSLKGLENLRSVGALALAWLPRVTDLQPLSGLASAQEVEISRMDGLRNLDGLKELSWQTLSITENPKLESLDGLHAPQGVTAVLIAGNP
ncbi:MAG TPA: hypothetical protein VJV78_09595, partial [Polyangiales bacterium]|nr:hypothetical protein [Polyangiales bacterium]